MVSSVSERGSSDVLNQYSFVESLYLRGSQKKSNKTIVSVIELTITMSK
jgi:hypothetical protein